MPQVLEHVEAAFLFVDPMRHMQLATVISSSPGTTLCLGHVLSQAFPAWCPYLAKSACNIFSGSSYCSAIYLPLDRCNLYVSWEVNVILTPFSQIYVYLGKPDRPECNVTTELCITLTPSSKCMGKMQYFFADSVQSIFHCFLPKQRELVWHTLTNSFLAYIFQQFFSLLIFHICMGGVLRANLFSKKDTTAQKMDKSPLHI